jgi:hypothetical protein
MFAKKKSLDAILSSFTKVVDDLRVLQRSNQEDIERYDNQILTLNALKEQRETESSRASKVEEKINSLLT